MTAGHPDWQTYAAWRGAPIVNQHAVSFPGGGLIFTITAIPHFSGVTLGVRNGTKSAQVLISFYADAGGTVLLSQPTFTVQAGAILSVNIPALGPYVQMQVINIPGSAGVIDLSLIPTNVAASRHEYFSTAGGAPLAWNSTSVPASGNFTVTTAEIYAGPIVVFVGTSSGTAYHYTASYFDPDNNTFQVIVGGSGSALGQRSQVAAASPPSNMQCTVINDDTVARTITIGILRAG